MKICGGARAGARILGPAGLGRTPLAAAGTGFVKKVSGRGRAIKCFAGRPSPAGEGPGRQKGRSGLWAMRPGAKPVQSDRLIRNITGSSRAWGASQ